MCYISLYFYYHTNSASQTSTPESWLTSNNLVLAFLTNTFFQKSLARIPPPTGPRNKFPINQIFTACKNLINAGYWLSQHPASWTLPNVHSEVWQKHLHLPVPVWYRIMTARCFISSNASFDLFFRRYSFRLHLAADFLPDDVVRCK